MVAVDITLQIYMYTLSLLLMLTLYQFKCANLTSLFVPSPSSIYKCQIYPLYTWRTISENVNFCFSCQTLHGKLEQRRTVYYIYPQVCCLHWSHFLRHQDFFLYYFLSVQRDYFSHFLRLGLLATNSLTFSLSEKVLILHCFLEDILVDTGFWIDTSFILALERCCVLPSILYGF